MGRIMKSAADRSADEVRKQRARLGDLHGEKAAAEAELAVLQQSAPEAYLNDESGSSRDKVARDLSELRERVDIIARAIPVQQQRVVTAESSYLTAKADEYETAAVEAREALERHRARTSELLRQLEDHEGRYLSAAEVSDRMSFEELKVFVAGGSGTVSYSVPKSRALLKTVERAERSVAILRALADGRTPAIQLWSGETVADAYPPCVWGPDALVPAPTYVREVEAAQHDLDGVERRAAELKERLARTEERNARMAEPVWDTTAVRGRLKNVPAQRAAAAARLRALTGAPAATAGVDELDALALGDLPTQEA